MLEQYKDFFEILFVGMVLVLTMFAFFQVVMKNYFEKPIIEEEFKNEAEIIILDNHRNNKKNVTKNHITIFGENSGLYKNKIR